MRYPGPHQTWAIAFSPYRESENGKQFRAEPQVYLNCYRPRKEKTKQVIEPQPRNLGSNGCIGAVWGLYSVPGALLGV